MSCLSNRDELLQWFEELLPDDLSYLEQSGGSYLKEIRELEALLRPMWAVLPAYFSGSRSKKVLFYIDWLQQTIENQELPEISTENRQIAVETGVLGYALGTYQADFLHLFSKSGQEYLVEWLNQLNHIVFPEGNWYFFLILVNGGLKKNDCKYSEIRLQEALEKIDSFYLGNGWYSDGRNFQRDYYVAFAFHFYGLLYSLFSKDAHAEKFKKRAVRFSEDFIYWFDEKGRSLPFGRSLTYRFAHVSFWVALILSDVYEKTPYSLGQIKKLILDHLRFWKEQPITASANGNLSIGYGYSQQLLSEDYNSPGSPMWAFKSFLLFELGGDAFFWQVAEEKITRQKSCVQKEAGFYIQTDAHQTTALSNLQYSQNEQLYHRQEKYNKFCYSTLFGFNISRGNEQIEQFAVDNCLAISMAGHHQFQSRTKIEQSSYYKNYGVSSWNLWDEVWITSYLLPIDARSHVRIHEITTPYALDTYEGGFPLWDWNKKYQQPQLTDKSCVLANKWGSSQLVDLKNNRQPVVVSQGPNTNIYNCEKNGVPALQKTVGKGTTLFASYVAGDTVKQKMPHLHLLIDETGYQVSIDQQKYFMKKEHFYDE